MRSLAHYTQAAFLVPSNSQYYWAYLSYDSSTKDLDPVTLLNNEASAASDNMNLASYTTTAMHHYRTLVPRADTSPPSAPGTLTGSSGNPATAYLKWTAATDDIGVAGYDILRNGLPVGTTAQWYFQDSGLTEGTTYTYTIQAFDLAGNFSSPTPAVQVRTRQVTPPTAPANVTATAVSRKQVDLAWSASSDNAGIRYYLVFQGTSAASLSQVAKTNGSNTGASIYYLTPGTTYYFAVQAQDTWGNLSHKSAIVPATTLP